jgi:hypothetical protein
MRSNSNGYHLNESATREFAKAFALLVTEVNRERLSTVISSRNTHRFRHGGDWSHPSSPDLSDGQLKKHGVEVVARFEELLRHDLGMLPRILQELSEGFHEQFMRSFYQTVNEACEKSGNSVSAKTQGLESALLEMMEKIEFSVTEDGQVSMPQIHAAPDVVKKLIELENTGSAEFRGRVKAIQERKGKEALDRELARRARFVGYGDE